jgi:hypothetical protein
LLRRKLHALLGKDVLGFWSSAGGGDPSGGRPIPD